MICTAVHPLVLKTSLSLSPAISHYVECCLERYFKEIFSPGTYHCSRDWTTISRSIIQCAPKLAKLWVIPVTCGNSLCVWIPSMKKALSYFLLTLFFPVLQAALFEERAPFLAGPGWTLGESPKYLSGKLISLERRNLRWHFLCFPGTIFLPIDLRILKV